MSTAAVPDRDRPKPIDGDGAVADPFAMNAILSVSPGMRRRFESAAGVLRVEEGVSPEA
jgi:hypothetical protein